MDFTRVGIVVERMVSQSGLSFRMWGLIVGVLCWFWITQFIQLMIMSEYDFPGHRDKWLWGIAFFVLPFVAPFAFCGWKLVQSEQASFDQDRESRFKKKRSKISSTRYHPSRN